MPGDPRWFADAAFWPDVAPVLFESGRWEAAEGECDGIVAALGLAPGASVLDVFCGPGRYLVPLAARGLQMTGVDASEAYVSEAAERLSTAGVDSGTVRLKRIDIGGDGATPEPPETSLQGPFDAALWLGSSSGYQSRSHDVAVLAWICSSLMPRSPLLIEGSTQEDLEDLPFHAVQWLEQRSPAAEPAESAVEAVWRLEQRVERSEGDCRLHAQWRRYVLGTLTTFDFEYRVYSRAEWTEMLHEAGFSNVICKNTLDGFKKRWSGSGAPDRELARSWIRAETRP